MCSYLNIRSNVGIRERFRTKDESGFKIKGTSVLRSTTILEFLLSETFCIHLEDLGGTLKTFDFFFEQ